jgi:hypothetical protein
MTCPRRASTWQVNACYHTAEHANTPCNIESLACPSSRRIEGSRNVVGAVEPCATPAGNYRSKHWRPSVKQAAGCHRPPHPTRRAMDSVAPLIRAFYGAQTSPADRQHVHDRLLESLSTDACVEAADEHIARCTAALAAPAANASPDSLVLHYALHAIETRVRTGFDATAQRTRKVLLEHLINFVVAALAWNMQVSGAQNHQGATIPLPMHVVMKAARVAVELGKREWVSDSTTAFPRVALALIDQNGHSATSLPRIYAGIVILTTLVDDALDSSRADVRASDRVALNQRIASIADGVVAALEIGLRISGPGLPSTVPAAAARTVGSIARVAPSAAASAVDILRRRSSGLGSCDVVGAETLGVLAELYGESKVSLPGPWKVVLRHLTEILNPVAMGEAALGDGETVVLFRKRLTMYAEAVLCRCVGSEAGSADMEHVLNGLMGATMRWAKESPSALPDALDAWMNILEVVEDGDVSANGLVTTAYGALSRLCVECCMFSSNGGVLNSLESADSDEDENGSVVEFEFGGRPENAEVLASMACSPAVYALMSSSLQVSKPPGGEEDVEGGELGVVSRETFIGKCVEALSSISRVFPDTVAMQVVDLCVRTLSLSIPPEEGAVAQVLCDMDSAVTLACAVSGMLPVGSTSACALANAVVRVFAQSPICRYGQDSPSAKAERGPWRVGLDVKLLQAASALAPTMAASSWADGPGICNSFIQATRSFLCRSESPRPLGIAAALLLLSIGELSREGPRFRSEPPISADIVRRAPSLAVACLGFVGIVRWAVEGAKASGNGQRGSVVPEVWPPRMCALQQCCGTVLSSYIAACSKLPADVDALAVREVARGVVLVWSMFSCLYEESSGCKDAVWAAVAGESCAKTLSGLRVLCEITSPSDSSAALRLGEDEIRFVQSVIGVMIGALGCALRVFRRQVAAEAPTLAQDVISAGLKAAKNDSSPHLARALLSALREQLGDGFSKDKEHLVAPAVELALQCLSGDIDVTVAAVSVLAEALTRHWPMFWPGDVATHLGDCSPVTPRSSIAQSPPNDAVQKVYLAAFGGIIGAVRHTEAAVSREGMLALERIDASRKLYSRAGAFQAVGGGVATIGACIGAMWASPLVAEEACGVVWGVGRADWNSLYGGGGSLYGAVCGLQACSDSQAAGLVQEFGQPTDRPTFTRALVALVNDLRYTKTMNSGPSM